MIKRFTDWLLSTFVRDHENLSDPAVRARYGFGSLD